MKKNHFIKIFISYILIILVGSIITGYLSIAIFKTYLINAAQVRMESNINLIKSSLQEQLQKNETLDFNYLSKKFSEDIGSTVTFVNEKGSVIGERIKGSNKSVDFIKSSEIEEAKKNDFGYRFFYNEEADIYTLNAAKYVALDKFTGYIHLTTQLREVSTVNKAITSYALIGVIFVLISSSLLKILFENDIINPLKEIAAASYKVGEGEVGTRINIKSDDTIGILADEYNTMLNKIENKFNQLVNKSEKVETGLNSVNIGVTVVDKDNRILYANPYILDLFEANYDSNEIQGRKVIELIKDSKTNNYIKEALEEDVYQEYENTLGENDKRVVKFFISAIKGTDHEGIIGCSITVYDITQIRQLEQMGADFVSNATHELKTPLTSIKGFIETLKSGAVEDKEVSYRFLDIIDLECDRLYSLINDILQLSEIQNLKRDVNMQLYYMQDIIPEVTAFLITQAEKKEIKISTDIQSDMPMIFINKNRIKQALINIIENAIKYSNQGGNVDIKAAFEDDKVAISVKDNGIGIPEESIPRLFERFYRVDKGRSRSQGGTGLGLSIVKHIVDLYDGTIDVISEKGKGTEFVIRLPLKNA